MVKMDAFNSDLRSKRGVLFNPRFSVMNGRGFGVFCFFSFCLHAEPMKGLRMQAEAVEILLKLVREGR